MIICQYMACYMAICLQDDNIWITPDHAIVHGSLDLFYAFYIESIYMPSNENMPTAKNYEH